MALFSFSPDDCLPRVAVGAVVFHGGKVLLVRRTKPPQPFLWAVPGGSVKAGERLAEAAEREVLEETGITVRAGNPVHCFDLIETNQEGEIEHHFVIIDLEADYVEGEVIAGDDADRAGWFEPSGLSRIPLSPTTRDLLIKLGFLT